MRRLFAAAIIAVVIVTAGAGTSRATVTFELNNVYTGNTPSGTGPWLTLKFEDFGVGQVLLTLTANLQSATEFVDTLGFNGPSGLAASTPDTGEFYSFGAAPSNLGGGGMAAFVIGFDFPNNNNNGGVERFNGSETMTIIFSATSAINETMFDDANASGHFAAAHINGIDDPNKPGVDDKGSGKITTGGPGTPVVPEPGTFALLALGGAGLAAFRRRRRPAGA